MHRSNHALLVAVLITPTCALAQLQWTQIQDWQLQAPATSVPYRVLAAMAATDTAIVLFGGDLLNGPPRNPSVPANDTWSWDPIARTWTDVTGVGPQPAPRAGHAMAFDRMRHRLVCFGGQGTGTFNDTWERGTQWTQVTTAVSPPARWRHMMAYDEQGQRVILFGGRSGTTLLADTWSYDGTNWSALQPPHSPPARYAATLTYDSVRQRCVLFGGTGTGGGLNDTWELVNNDWVQAQPSVSPPARSQHAATYDTYQRRTLVFGGTANAVPPHDLDDVWAWDGTNWRSVPTAGTPAPMSRHAIAYFGYQPGLNQPSDNGILLVGEGSCWTFSAPPPPRQGHVMQDFVGAAPLPEDDLLMLTGWDTAPMADAWHYGSHRAGDRGIWEVDPNATVAPRAWSAMVHREEVPFVNGAQGYDYFFGGMLASGQDLMAPRSHTNSWFYYPPPPGIPRSSVWSILTISFPPQGPAARHMMGTAFDPSRLMIVMFGGQSGSTVLGEMREQTLLFA